MCVCARVRACVRACVCGCGWVGNRENYLTFQREEIKGTKTSATQKGQNWLARNGEKEQRGRGREEEGKERKKKRGKEELELELENLIFQGL